MKLIDKAAIVAEIENLIADESESIKSFEHSKNVSEVQRSNARISVLEYIHSFLDGLEMKEIQKKNLYVVTRCEEHSDYVEKAFFSKEKAENYCKQFEGNEDAYGRDITEIEVDYPLEVKDVVLEKLGEIARHLIAVKEHIEDMRLDKEEWFMLEKIGYPGRFKAQKGE